MKDIIIDDNKLKIENGAFIYTKTDLAFAYRAVTEVLQTIVGEDPQDESKGLNLDGVIFNLNSSSSDIYAEVLRNVLKVDGVEEVTDIEITQTQEDLKVNVYFVYNGESVSVTVTQNN